MKKLLFALIVLASTLTLTSFAEEVSIDQSELPKGALKFIEQHYPTDKISLATVEKDFLDKDYKVILTNGVLIEFDSNGNWTEVECRKNRAVPAAIVDSKVAEYVTVNYPDNKIVKIERSKKEIDIELDNGIDLDFDGRGNLVEIDY